MNQLLMMLPNLSMALFSRSLNPPPASSDPAVPIMCCASRFTLGASIRIEDMTVQWLDQPD